MLRLFGPGVSPSESIDRREMLRIGALGASGLTLSSLLELQAQGAKKKANSSSFGKAKNCIILFQSGGAAHLDTYDPKPNAPAEVRGEFKNIPSKIPGVHLTEHLPLTAKVLDKCAVIRSMNHPNSGHAGGGYAMFTGYRYPASEGAANFMSREDHPHVGATMAKVSPGKGPMVPFVIVPRRLDAGSGRRAGQWGGRMGGKYDPLQTGGNPNDDNFKLDHLPLVANRPGKVLRRRKRLLDQVNQQVESLRSNAISRALNENQAKALSVLESEKVRRAVDLSSADPKERTRYGRNLYGQSVLLGRRMLEAGSRVVQVSWLRSQGKKGFAWDSHWNNHEALKEDLIPPYDLAFYALVNDLEERGMLDETLVVCAGEFGRTPRITQKTGGREHYANCFSILMAGGGIKGGQVYGSSDANGAYPASDPVSPADYTATLYHCLGVDPHTEMIDQGGRPMRLSEGKPIKALIG